MGEAGGLNLYGYLQNNPIDGFDVLGLKCDQASDYLEGELALPFNLIQALSTFYDWLDKQGISPQALVMVAPELQMIDVTAEVQAAESETFAEGAASTWDTSIPQTGKYLNVGTNVTATDFQANLTSNGFNVLSQGVSSNGPFTVLSNGQTTYTIYTATSTGEASAQVFNSAGQTLLKYRLGGP